MRRFLKSSVRVLGIGWFWTSVVLVLPNCSLDASGIDLGGGSPPAPSSSNLFKGSEPLSDVIYCNIEVERHCPTDDEIAAGILDDPTKVRFSDAAIALVEGRGSDIGLDDSPASLGTCDGKPQVVTFRANFPLGFPVCLNCGEAIGSGEGQSVDNLAVCQKQCLDFFTTTNGDGDVIVDTSPPPERIDFCNTFSWLSTNMPPDSCLAGVCTSVGTEIPDGDPRQKDGREPVVWTNLVGTGPGATPGSIMRTAPATGMWDASAVSQQWIRKVTNGYIEFSVTGNQRIGLTVIPVNCAAPCDDFDPDLNGISFALDFGGDGHYYIFEGATKTVGPGTNASFGDYVPGDRFRITVKNVEDGTPEGKVSIVFAPVLGACDFGMVCNTPAFYTREGVPRGQFRADVALIDVGSSFDDVKIVYIK